MPTQCQLTWHEVAASMPTKVQMTAEGRSAAVLCGDPTSLSLCTPDVFLLPCSLAPALTSSAMRTT